MFFEEGEDEVVKIEEGVVKGEADGGSSGELFAGMDGGEAGCDVGKVLVKSFEGVGIAA